MQSFSSRIYKIGINPYVVPPASVMKIIFKEARKNKGPFPVHGTLNGHKFIQNIVKFRGKWRLYLNTPMRKSAGIDVGDMALVKIQFDPKERVTAMHPKMHEAFEKNKTAKDVFDKLIPSRKKEIMRYINNLKTEESIDKNVLRAINFLLEKERFIGRDKP
ncbi:MAG: DUF1905 domain-containing protein [Bacteroidetes bacterium]|nr:DUF1905 domain-containing protein [Bacteroidota bacterium]